MHCDRARELIGAYIDEELGGDDQTAVTNHVKSCAACRVLMSDIERTSKAIAELGRKPAPTALAARIRSSLATEAQEQPARLPVNWSIPSRMWRQAAVLVACSILSALLTWGVATSSNQVKGLQQEIVAAHIRSLLQDSPVQVASSDSHTVKPWFAGRVDFSPEAKDLAAEGFPLLGGRLDYVHQRRVGVLVYGHRLHMINVFMWRAPDSENVAPKLFNKNGHNLILWTRSGVTYAAVSDLDGGELKRLQSLL
jgi:anti-sigma factor RsiW